MRRIRSGVICKKEVRCQILLLKINQVRWGQDGFKEISFIIHDLDRIGIIVPIIVRQPGLDVVSGAYWF